MNFRARQHGGTSTDSQMNILGGLKQLRSRFGVTMVRDSGGARMTVALRGRPFSRALHGAPAATRVGKLRGIKLNVGGGKGHPRVPGWTVVDLRETADVRMDITTAPLPFDDDSVSIIFTSHTLEHIYPQQLDFVLGEFHRVLRRTDGLLRISVPDIALAIKAYVEQREQFFYDSEVGLDERNVPMAGLLASWLYSTTPLQGSGWARRTGARPLLRRGLSHVPPAPRRVPNGVAQHVSGFGGGRDPNRCVRSASPCFAVRGGGKIGASAR